MTVNGNGQEWLDEAGELFSFAAIDLAFPRVSRPLRFIFF
jgi:hypothetical protein